VDRGDFTSVRRSEANLEGLRTPLKDRIADKELARKTRVSRFLETPLGMLAMQLGFLSVAALGSALFLRVPVLGTIWSWLTVLAQGYLFAATFLTYQGVTDQARGTGSLILLLPIQFILLAFFFFAAL
jgi:hypothetical protein